MQGFWNCRQRLNESISQIGSSHIFILWIYQRAFLRFEKKMVQNKGLCLQILTTFPIFHMRNIIWYCFTFNFQNFILFIVTCSKKGKLLFPIAHSFSKTIEWINCITDFWCVNSIPITFFSLSQKISFRSVRMPITEILIWSVVINPQ